MPPQSKIRRCMECKSLFEGNIDTSCPSCGSTKSSPAYNIDPHEKIVTAEPPDRIRYCPECRTEMRKGFIVERNTPLQLSTIGEGVYWTPGEAGVLGQRVALKAYMCPNCGYMSTYARFLKRDHETILKAGTT
jgi:hypothetical protein